MVELDDNKLVFWFPEVHESAKLVITFHRTLRIPDDNRDYPLPPGLGHFPLRHVDDHENEVPKDWIQRGGVLCPMYQSEALWIGFEQLGPKYPFAVKVATGKINAITGAIWEQGLGQLPQNYLVAPRQPWLDGFHISKGVIRQFVAMPLGAGYTAEEQISESDEYGGLQIEVFPMFREAFEERARLATRQQTVLFQTTKRRSDMGLAPGGLIRQEIYKDTYRFEEWNQQVHSRCFVQIVNSLMWRSITGQNPPQRPFTAKEYTNAGLPWFDYYRDDTQPLQGSSVLAKMKSIASLGLDKGDVPLPENESVLPAKVVLLKNQVREGTFDDSHVPLVSNKVTANTSSGAKTKEMNAPMHSQIVNTGELSTHPWRRLFARSVEILVWTTIFGLVAGVVLGSSVSTMSTRIDSPIRQHDLEMVFSKYLGVVIMILAYATWLPVEALMLSKFGTTPSKWCFGIRVKTANGENPSFDVALSRAARVWLFGDGLGIPLLGLFTRIAAYKRLTKYGATSWDEDCSTQTIHSDWGVFRALLCTSLVIVYLYVLAVLTVLSKGFPSPSH